ncbi:MAG: hypothetical protein HKP40_03840 [Litoreibacter sp.]|nr:hypothetical protein [Litoreibacter sp.]
MPVQNSIRETFFEECEDLLEALSEGLGQIAESETDAETVNAVFRAVHSIKGGAGAFGLDVLVQFAHRFETVLDKLRNDEMEKTPELMRVLLRSGDILADLVEAARNEEDSDAQSIAAPLADLDAVLGTQPQEEATPPTEFEFQPMTLELDGLAGTPEDPVLSQFSIFFKPGPDLFANGHDPVLLFGALEQLGSLQVALEASALPSFEALEQTQPYLAWTIALATEETETVIHEVFEFVEGLCELQITPLGNEITSSEIEAPPLSATSDVSQAETTAAPDQELAQQIPERRGKDARRTPRPKEQKGPRPTLRVDLDRVDRLINTVGELIINQAMIAQRIGELGLPSGDEVANDLEDYKLLARDIQEAVMAIRAQPVKSLFQRMGRIGRGHSKTREA